MTGVEEGAVLDSFDWRLGGGFFGGDYLFGEMEFRDVCQLCLD